MSTIEIILIILGCLLVFSLIIFPIILGLILCLIHMVRTSKNKWGRVCSLPTNKEQLTMWNEGLDYISNYKDKIKEVHIVNDNLNLYGEYVDIHADKTVIILGGRCESLYYGYYYAKPYLENNCNVLVIDQRAHGLSDGKVNSSGFNEAKDLYAWVKYLHDELNNKEIFIHGTCIGAATAIYMLANENAPSYVTKLISDSTYSTYYETFKKHVIALKQPVFPTTQITFIWYKLLCGHNAKKYGPISEINKIKADVIMIASLQDQYVSKKETLSIANNLNKDNKNNKLIFLEYGGHSHIRINNKEKYDKIIIDNVLKYE